tara:strand:+ start:514 stop:795 length:282 start_codon:yes stop_codon:yes gene_type:complete
METQEMSWAEGGYFKIPAWDAIFNTPELWWTISIVIIYAIGLGLRFLTRNLVHETNSLFDLAHGPKWVAQSCMILFLLVSGLALAHCAGQGRL